MNAQDPAQLTVRAIVLSLVLAVLLAAANAYLGLFAGLTVATAIPAAVVSMGVLRLMGRSNILENNIVATGASAASSIAAGTIFTVPALVIMGHWARFDYWWVLAIAGLGGLLGVLFSVPLRRTLILDQGLQFPEGVATAEVLKVGAEGGGGVGLLVISGLIGAVVKLGAAGLRLWAEVVQVATFLTGGAAQLSPCVGIHRDLAAESRNLVLIISAVVAGLALCPAASQRSKGQEQHLARVRRTVQLAGSRPLHRDSQWRQQS